jgi:TPR repeat protein
MQPVRSTFKKHDERMKSFREPATIVGERYVILMSNTLENQTENFQITDLRGQAKQGDAEAQYNLGMLYYEGHGITRDYVTARHCWEQAAAQGNAWAPYRLEVLYQKAQRSPVHQ